jgi:chromosome segregation ATPase
MTSLFETLPLLEKALPTVPGKFEEAARDGQAYIQAVRGFLGDIEQKHHNLTELRQQVQTVLDALEEQATQEHTALDAALKTLDTAVDQTLASVQEDEGEVKTAVDASSTALDQLKADLTGAAARTRAAQQEATGEFEDLWKALESDRSELESAVQGVVAKAGELDTEITQGRAAVAQALTGLGDKMEQALEQARAQLGEARARVQSQLSQLEGELGEAVGELATGRGKVIDDLEKQVASDVRQKIDEAVGNLVEAIGSLGTGMIAALDACRTDREQVEPEVESLRGRFPPLLGAVTSVQQTCREVGADWPA